MIADRARDSRATADVGRSARLELVFERRGHRTVLAHSYAEPPFRVSRTFEEGEGLHLMMASSAPGMFGGDAFEQSIHVGRGARVRLTSQSALQVHRSVDDAPATLHSHYRVEDEGVLQCQWDALIPFAGARFDQRIDIALSPLAQVYWSDAFMSGRVSAVPVERWAFTSLGYELRVRRAEATEYLERYRIVPRETSVSSRWTVAEANYFGTMLMSGFGVPADRVEEWHREIAGAAGVTAAVDQLAPALIVARVMAREGVPFHECRAAALAIVMSCNELAPSRACEETVKTP